jgi:hypothetical protein
MNRIAHWALLAFFAAQNSSTISVESRLVSVDVIVRDARGNPCPASSKTPSRSAKTVRPSKLSPSKNTMLYPAGLAITPGL